MINNMGLSEEGDENVEDRYEELCLDLNMDKNTKEEAWDNYDKIRQNYTLEVNETAMLIFAFRVDFPGFR